MARMIGWLFDQATLDERSRVCFGGVSLPLIGTSISGVKRVVCENWSGDFLAGIAIHPSTLLILAGPLLLLSSLGS